MFGGYLEGQEELKNDILKRWQVQHHERKPHRQVEAA